MRSTTLESRITKLEALLRSVMADNAEMRGELVKRGLLPANFDLIDRERWATPLSSRRAKPQNRDRLQEMVDAVSNAYHGTTQGFPTVS